MSHSSRRGLKVACAVGGGGSLLLVLALAFSWHAIWEQWYLHTLETSSDDRRRLEAAVQLSEMGSLAAIPVMADTCVTGDVSPADPFAGPFESIIEKRQEEALPALVEVLDRMNAGLKRDYVLRSLVRIEKLDGAGELLGKLLSEGDSAAIALAPTVLPRMGKAAEPAIPGLFAELSRRTRSQRSLDPAGAFSVSLISRGPVDPLVELLVALVDDLPEAVQGRLGELNAGMAKTFLSLWEEAAGISAVAAALEHADPVGRRYIVFYLGESESRDNGVIHALRQAGDGDTDPRVRELAELALAKLGE